MNGKQTDPLSNSLREVLDFFADIFVLEFEYSNINTHRSAISVFHEPIEEFSVRKSPKTCNLMTDVYKNIPAKPRYLFVWDIQTVSRYLISVVLKTLLRAEMLTLKLKKLLALTSASRCSEI